MNNLFYPNMSKDFRVVVFVALLFSLYCFTLQKVGFGKYSMILYVIVGLGLIPAIMKRPIAGLYVLPFVVYVIPEINITGLPRLSLGFFVSFTTLLSAMASIAFGHTRPKPSWLWLLVMVMIIIQFIYVVACENLGYFFNFVQGITPFLLFSLIVDTESDARRVLLAWLTAWTVFCFVHMLDEIFSNPSFGLVRALLSTREEHFGNYNPNTLGHIGLLYLPLAYIMVGTANRTLGKLKWGMVLILILLFLIFCFSRSAVVGMVMTFGLLILFDTKSIKKRLQLLLITTAIVLFLFAMWESVNRDTWLLYSLKTQTGVRLSMISDGLKYIYLNPWFGNGPIIKVATHSYFTSVAMEYGLIFFPIFCLPFIYIVVVGRKLSRYGRSEQVRSFARGIVIAGLVAVPLAVFGITMKGAGYLQVFWLLIGYLHVANRELDKQEHMEPPNASR